MASSFYNIGLEKILAGTMLVGSDTMKVRLQRVSAYTFAATNASMTPVTVATSTPADVTLSSVSLKTGADGGCVDWADAVYTAVTAGAAIDCLTIYKFVTNDAASFPCVYLDGFTVTPNGGDITLQWANSNPWVFKI